MWERECDDLDNCVIMNYYYQWFYSSLSGLGRYFQFLDPIHSQYDSLDGGSARRKVSTYTQDNINTE
jgi:hypothetical protein